MKTILLFLFFASPALALNVELSGNVRSITDPNGALAAELAGKELTTFTISFGWIDGAINDPPYEYDGHALYEADPYSTSGFFFELTFPEIASFRTDAGEPSGALIMGPGGFTMKPVAFEHSLAAKWIELAFMGATSGLSLPTSIDVHDWDAITFTLFSREYSIQGEVVHSPEPASLALLGLALPLLRVWRSREIL